MKKRILALMLTAVLLINNVPVSVLAEQAPAAPAEISLEPGADSLEGAGAAVMPVDEPVAEPCPTCGVEGCTSEHLNWCDVCKKDDCGVGHTVVVEPCPICDVVGCEKEHIKCTVCNNYDCTVKHAYCDVCKKYDCGVDHTVVVEPCPTCGVEGCTSEHLNWCDVCEKDDCGKIHVFCQTCKIYDCGKNHVYCYICSEYDCGGAHTLADDSEYRVNVDKFAQFDLTYGSFPVVSAPSGVGKQDVWNGDIQIFAADLPKDLVLVIADVYVNEAEGIYWYEVENATGAALPDCFPEPAWVFQNYLGDTFGDSLIIIEKPQIGCGCCEDCTGIEDCDCGCTDCDFYEEPEIPDDPDGDPFSETIIDSEGNELTVSVSGDALPEGARLEVNPVPNEAEILAELDMEGGFLWDIKVYDAEGNEWQPIDIREEVSVSFDIPGLNVGMGVGILHFLDDASAIASAMKNGSAEVVEFSNEVDRLRNVVIASRDAWQQATGNTGDYYVIEEQIAPCTENGRITIATDSFSVWAWNGSAFSWERYTDADQDDKLVMNTSGKAPTVYASNGTTLIVTTGANTNGKGWGVNQNQTLKNTGDIDATLTVTGLAVGTTITVEYDRTLAATRYAYIRVVEERMVTFNENGHGYNQLTDTIDDDGRPGTRYGFYVYDGVNRDYVDFPTITENGYTFRGWSRTENGSSGLVDQTNYIPGSTKETLYAQWSANTYTVKFDPNTDNAGGGTITGSMSTVSMTYDVETTLPRCKYVNSAYGYVFVGWATSPTGDAVHKDGAKIKNLTTSNNGTVTLYAKWKYGLDSTVYIGINNSYHNPNGTYTAGGVTIDSYHKYPNEPAQMTADFDRVTDDKGGWRYDKESAVPLKNTAESYINGNIFNSPDYEMTPVEGENTLGIADPMGKAVRSMLKFTEEDYQAMISVWLNGMRNTLIGYGDTSVDWANAKAEDFVMVPYVIKFQNYDSWYIDMAVVPKALYTLAYDGNIENGYTASFNGVAFPPSAQHTEGSSVQIVTTPIGYQSNNLKVTKVVDGHTYTAIFQYWYDAQGNTYGGSTGKNTLTLTEDTVLYAKWDYPDASFGNLNITKTVVDKDAYENPSATQGFTFKFTTSASGSYNYAIYDRSANVKASGTIANNGTFTLQDGWRIRILDLPKDASYGITETAVSYYTTNAVSGKVSAGATTYATVTNTYQKNAGYTVKHYLQKSDKTGYVEQTADQQNLYGVIGANTNAAVKTYDGYQANGCEQLQIQADGTTVVEIYYDLLISYTVSYDANDGIGTISAQEKRQGETLTLSNGTGFTRNGYTLTGWNTAVDGSGTTYGLGSAYSENAGATLYAQWQEKSVTIKYNVNDANRGSVDPETETVLAVTGKPVGSIAIAKSGYYLQKWINAEGNKVGDAKNYTPPKEDGVYKAATYTAVFEPLTYIATFKLGYGNAAPATQTFQINDTWSLPSPTRPGYNFQGWSATEVKGSWQKGRIYTGDVFGQYGDITFTAEWEELECTISYRESTLGTGVGGSVSPATESVKVDTGNPVGATATEYDGYQFLGWFDNALGNEMALGTAAKFEPQKKLQQDGTSRLFESATYYAVFKPISYTATFKMTEQDQNPITRKFTIEGAVPLDIPTIAGYQFNGWKVTEHASQSNWTNNEQYANDAVAAENGKYGDVTFTAQWTENECTITYSADTGGTVNEVDCVSETIGVVTGKIKDSNQIGPLGATAKANPGYEFVGWFIGDSETPISTELKYVPQKGIDQLYAGATYTAKFKLSVVDLTITVGTESLDEQSLIFDVVGTPVDQASWGEEIRLKVVLTETKKTITIHGLPVGKYTVTEKDGWSWRQTWEQVDPENAQITLDNPAGHTVRYALRSTDNIYWLNGYNYGIQPGKKTKGGGKR